MVSLAGVPFLGSAFGGLLGVASSRQNNHNFGQEDPFHISMYDINPNFEFSEKKEEKKEVYPKHNIPCKSRKDAKDKASNYGGGPPEGPHHDGYGSHFHATRRKKGVDKPIKIKNVHFMYKINKPFIYKIQRGDCLSKIAQRFGVRVDDLVRWNNIPNPDLIYEGKTLKIYG